MKNLQIYVRTYEIFVVVRQQFYKNASREKKS